MNNEIIKVIAARNDLTYAVKSCFNPGRVNMILRKEDKNASIELYALGMTDELIKEAFYTLLNKLGG